ncbi:TATA box-binding protein-associated factor RNA polymerase I subunit C isoform X4 [Lynx canadensis]|uniref:TATA box-binding protein-associated factor RNA polymerase I subunit C isoform X4 n=1 Tax=Lynx canadensis TaxID=61383 RepID=UPI0011B0B951|nr:TATA box-binding protein-associated factor RNA polymerase I subunit C isoform X4 [Lynx canadensis]
MAASGCSNVPGLPSASDSAGSPSSGAPSWARLWPACWESCCMRSWPRGGSGSSWTTRLPGARWPGCPEGRPRWDSWSTLREAPWTSYISKRSAWPQVVTPRPSATLATSSSEGLSGRWRPTPCKGKPCWLSGLTTTVPCGRSVSRGAPPPSGCCRSGRGPQGSASALTCLGSWLSAAVREPSACGPPRMGMPPSCGSPLPRRVLDPGPCHPVPTPPSACLPAHGWPVSPRLRQIYKDPETLVFRDPSPWRWADFTAHPRVLTVGDRTGVKIIDTQGPPGCGLLLFRGGAEAACQKGERVLLTRYLGGCGPEPLCPTFHLILTQFSLYLVDERLPLVPLLKWNHDLPSAPLFAQLLPPPQPGHAQPLLLGGQGGHLRLLQLAGTGASAPRLAGPPQSLPSSSDSLSAFPLLEPKSQWRLQERLKAPTIGLAAALLPSASAPVLFLFQLSAAGDVFHQRLRLQADPGLASSAPVASWTPQATACCGRWLKALLEIPLPPPVWAAPNFSHRRVLGCVEPRQMEQKVPDALRAAMAEGRLLLRRDLGAVPSAEPPPAPEPGPEDELSARLEAAWEGRAAAWWESQQGGSSGPGKRPRRHKRRTQLSSTFSSLSGRLDLSDATSPPRSPDRTSPEARPQPPVTPPSQELTQEPWARGVPSERQQTLRDYMAKLPLRGDPPGGVPSPLSQASGVRATPSGQQPLQDGSAERPLRRHTLGGAAVPSSQTSSVRATPSRQQAPVPSGSQPRRRKPRMGF